MAGNLEDENIERTKGLEDKMRGEALKAAQSIKEQEKALEPLIT